MSTSQKSSTKRTRVFSIVTYVSEADIQDAIYSHSRSLRSYAYILHDQDEAEPHYHLLLRTYDAWSSTQIAKWFDKYKLKDNNNTFVEPATDLHALQEYITHSDYKSIQEGKHQYSLDDVVDGGLFDMIEKKDAYDGTFEIVNAMLQGVPTRTLVRRYGKQLIYHYSQFCAIVDAINHEDHYERERLRPEDERLPFGWRHDESYDAPDYARVKVLSDSKPIPLDNIDIDDVLK